MRSFEETARRAKKMGAALFLWLVEGGGGLVAVKQVIESTDPRQLKSFDVVKAERMNEEPGYDEEELEFYSDLAMNECQRWIERITGERFLEDEDFLFSLREGSQIQRIAALLNPALSRIPSGTTNPDWPNEFRRHALSDLNINPSQLFEAEDLVDCIYCGDRLTPGTLRRIQKVIVTIKTLEEKLNASSEGVIPNLDSSAIDPFLAIPLLDNPPASEDSSCSQIDECLDSGNLSANSHLTLSDQKLDPSKFEKDKETESGMFLSLPVHVEDPAVSERISKYLSDLSTKEQDRVSTSDLERSTRSSSPAEPPSLPLSPPQSGSQKNLEPPPEPLKFIATPGGAPLAEKARQQIQLATEAKAMKEEASKYLTGETRIEVIPMDDKMATFLADEWARFQRRNAEAYYAQAQAEEEDDSDWQTHLDKWKSKRKTSSSHLHAASYVPPSTPPEEPTPTLPRRTTLEETEVDHSTKPVAAHRHSKDRKDEEASDPQTEDVGTFQSSPSAQSEREEETNKEMRTKDPVVPQQGVQGKRTLIGSLEDSGHFETDSDEPSYYAHSRSPKGVGHSVWSSTAPFGDTLSSDDTDTIPSVPSPRPAAERISQRRDSSPESRESRDREPKWTYQLNKQNAPKSQEVLTIVMEQRHVEKGFGFTVRGGKDQKEDVVVGGVVVGSVADRARLQVGDVILSLNGESVTDKLLPKVNMIIREALRLGEIEMEVKRTHFGGAPKLIEESPRRERSPRTKASFDQKRSLFTSEDSIPTLPSERKDSVGSTVASYNSFPDTQSLARKPTEENKPATRAPEVVNSADALKNGPLSPILQRAKRPGRIEDWVPEAERETGRSPSPNDYRVTSLSNKPRAPGKITDFVPESERSQRRHPSGNRGLLSDKSQAEEEMDSHWEREKNWIAARISVDGDTAPIRRSRSRDDETRKSFNEAFDHTFAPPPPPSVQSNRLTVATAQSDTTSSKSTASPASSQLTSPHSSSASEGKDVQDFVGSEYQNSRPVSPRTHPTHPTPPQSVSRIDIPQDPRSPREKMEEARRSFLGLRLTYSPSQDILEPAPVAHLRLKAHEDVLAKAERILSTPAQEYLTRHEFTPPPSNGVSSSFQGASRKCTKLSITFVPIEPPSNEKTSDNQRSVPPQKKSPVSTSFADPQPVTKKETPPAQPRNVSPDEPPEDFYQKLLESVPILRDSEPLRYHDYEHGGNPESNLPTEPVVDQTSYSDQEYELLDHQRSFNNYREGSTINHAVPEPTDPREPIETEREEVEKIPYSHVKRDVIFSSEPAPWEKKLITAKYPPLTKQLETNEVPAYVAPMPRVQSPPPVPTSSVPQYPERQPMKATRPAPEHRYVPSDTAGSPVRPHRKMSPIESENDHRRLHEPAKVRTYSPASPSYSSPAELQQRDHPISPQPYNPNPTTNIAKAHAVPHSEFYQQKQEPLEQRMDQQRHPNDHQSYGTPPMGTIAKDAQYQRRENEPHHQTIEDPTRYDEDHAPVAVRDAPKLTAAEQLAVTKPYQPRTSPHDHSPNNQGPPRIHIGEERRVNFDNAAPVPYMPPKAQHTQQKLPSPNRLNRQFNPSPINRHPKASPVPQQNVQRPLEKTYEDELRETELRFLQFAAEHQYEDEFRRHHKIMPSPKTRDNVENLKPQAYGSNSSRLAPSPIARSPIVSPVSQQPYVEQFNPNRAPYHPHHPSAVSPKSYAAPRYSYESDSTIPSNYSASSKSPMMMSPAGAIPSPSQSGISSLPEHQGGPVRKELAAGEPESPPLPSLPPPSLDSSGDVVSVSGRQRCTHCNKELGRGAAMIIESLNLFYHLTCFRCYVCRLSLGTGGYGADVRVRAGKLHCQSCYSNDEAGLKFSEV